MKIRPTISDKLVRQTFSLDTLGTLRASLLLTQLRGNAKIARLTKKFREIEQQYLVSFTCYRIDPYNPFKDEGLFLLVTLLRSLTMGVDATRSLSFDGFH